MPTVPQTKATWTSDVDALSSTNLHAYLRDPIKFLMSKPSAELRANAAQSVTTGTWTNVVFQVESLDSDPDSVGGHSTVTNTSRYTARYAGWYAVGGSATFTTSGTGRRGVRWAVNGSVVPASEVFVPGTAAGALTVQAPTMLVSLAEGDYLEMQIWQDSGGSLNTFSATGNQSRLTAEWSRLT